MDVIILRLTRHGRKSSTYTEAAKQQWATMSAHMKSSDIARVTHSNHRTINRALSLSRLTGSVVQSPLLLTM